MLLLLLQNLGLAGGFVTPGEDDEEEQSGIPAGTFGDYSGTNANLVCVPSNYEICDRSGFRVIPGTLRKQWDGLRVRPQDWDSRHPQEFLRARPEKPSPPTRPEPVDNFIQDDAQVDSDEL